MLRRIMLLALALGAALPAQQKYTGPRPPKPDVPYLLHAANLVETEASEAKEEKKKDDVTYVVAGAASPARTPLAEPIFLFESKKIAPERLQLYRLESKNGRREVIMRKKKNARPLHLSVKRLDTGLYRIEAAEYLDNGEYSLSPSDSNQVFCFQVY